MRAKAVGPFDKADRGVEGLLEAQFPDLVGMGQAVKIGVPDFDAPVLIDLDKGEGRRGHLFLAAKARADEGAGEAAFPGSDRPFEEDHVPGSAEAGKAFAQGFGRGCRGQVQRDGGGKWSGHGDDFSRVGCSRKPVVGESCRASGLGHDVFETGTRPCRTGQAVIRPAGAASLTCAMGKAVWMRKVISVAPPVSGRKRQATRRPSRSRTSPSQGVLSPAEVTKSVASSQSSVGAAWSRHQVESVPMLASDKRTWGSCCQSWA